MKTYPKMSAHGYTRDQLHFRREHSGAAPMNTGPAFKSLVPWASGAGFALVIGTLLILKAQNAPIALGGLGCCLVGLGLSWFVGHQLGATND